MGAIFDFIRDLVKLIWPFEIVQEYEFGVYYFCGHYWKTMARGLKLVLPWFCKIILVPRTPTRIQTPRIELTVEGGGTVSFTASAFARVVDAAKATNEVDNYQETVIEILTAICAEKVGAVDVGRLAPEKRTRLLSDLTKWVNAETTPFGVEVAGVVFTSFVTNVRIYRLLTEATGANTSW